MRNKNLTHAELVAVYRALSPDADYWGNAPEEWTVHTLLAELRKLPCLTP